MFHEFVNSYTKSAHRGIRPAIFLDRDVVINQRIQGGYVTGRREFKLSSVPEIAGIVHEFFRSDRRRTPKHCGLKA